MQVEEISFVNDVIQDNRANARIEQAYDILIATILNNSRLNWDKDGLIVESDKALFELIEILEFKKYNETLRNLILQDEAKKEKEKMNK